MEAGALRALLVVLLILGGLGFLFQSVQDTDYEHYMILVYAGSMVGLHFRRPDNRFLRSKFERPYQVYMIEYFTLGLPIVVSLLIQQQFLSLLLVLLVSAVIPFIRRPRLFNIQHIPIYKLVPPLAFELRAGLRSHGLLIGLLFCTGLFTSFFEGAVPITLAFTVFSITSFYQTNEPSQFLICYQLSPRQLIKQKLRHLLSLYFFIALPLSLSFLIFHLELWLIIVLENLVLIGLLCYSVLAKYAFYQSNENSPSGQLMASLGFVFSLVPFLFPLILLLGIRFYKKSIVNLNYYLSDFNS